MIRPLLLIISSIFSAAYGVQWTINQSGLYVLGSSLQYDPGVIISDSIIRITTSNVVLDLGNNYLEQIGITSGLTGITVDPGLSNITIRNGTIINSTGFGVVVSQGCSAVTISDISMVNCGAGGIALSGAASPNQIKNCTIEDVQCIELGLSLTATGIALSNCVSCGVSNCRILRSGNGASDFVGISLSNSFANTLNNVGVQGCTGLNLMGFEIDQSSNNVFKQCFFTGNTMTTGMYLLGFHLIGDLAPNQTNYNLFDSCSIIGNADTVGGVATVVAGIRLQSNVQNNLFINCIMNGDRTVGTNAVFGISIPGDTTCSYNTFERCIIQGLNSTTASVVGIASAAGAINCIIKDSLVANNISTAALGIGLYMLTVGGSFWTVKNNYFARNNGSSNANSSGIRELAGVNNLYSENIGFRNGATAGNQLNSIPAGSTTTPAAPASSNIAAVTGAWTNIAAAA